LIISPQPNFVQFVEVTRVPTRGSSWLDLILCNDAQLVRDVEVIPPIGNSDHASVDFKILDSRLNKRLLRYNAYLEKKVVESGDSTKPGKDIDKEHFQGIFAKEDDVFSHKVPPCGSTMGPDLWFHRDEIFDLLSKWPNSHSVTPDFIPLHLIKRTAHCLALPLELLFNLSYMRSEVPSRWRHSFIVPVPKKPPFSNPSNYRPIMTTYLNRNSLIPINQHGFSTGKSTETALLTSFNDWTNALDSRKPVHVVYFDFAKAFDRVPHRKLTAKLESLGIYPLIVRWIESFLCNRTYQVRIGDSFSSKYSSKYSITSGVPQGGVLSPLLFIAYTACLPASLSRFGLQNWNSNFRVSSRDKGSRFHLLQQTWNVEIHIIKTFGFQS
ncbi:hypothetical protein COOONC_27120, partial [Cooperia oncophora]